MEFKNYRRRFLKEETEEANAIAAKYMVITAAASVGICLLSFVVNEEAGPDPTFLLVGGLLMLVLYFARFEKLKEKYKKRDESLERGLPNFLLELILLLDGGMVLSSAIMRIADEKDDCDIDENPLSFALRQSVGAYKSQQTEILHELYEFARKMESRDLMRVVSLLYQGRNHGNELVSKLERERNGLMQQRGSRARRLASEIDTKLCFPLMLLLIAILIISAAPALMNMR